MIAELFVQVQAFATEIMPFLVLALGADKLRAFVGKIKPW